MSADNVKILLVGGEDGGAGVGKTCLTNRFTCREFVESKGPTVGANLVMHETEVDGVCFKMEISGLFHPLFMMRDL